MWLKLVLPTAPSFLIPPISANILFHSLSAFLCFWFVLRQQDFSFPPNVQDLRNGPPVWIFRWIFSTSLLWLLPRGSDYSPHKGKHLIHSRTQAYITADSLAETVHWLWNIQHCFPCPVRSHVCLVLMTVSHPQTLYNLKDQIAAIPHWKFLHFRESFFFFFSLFQLQQLL